MKNLNYLGVEEMSPIEMVITDGGSVKEFFQNVGNKIKGVADILLFALYLTMGGRIC